MLMVNYCPNCKGDEVSNKIIEILDEKEILSFDGESIKCPECGTKLKFTPICVDANATVITVEEETYGKKEKR